MDNINEQVLGETYYVDEPIDWKRKLSSRKFWALLAAFFNTALVMFGVPDNQVAQCISAMMAGACVIAYILGESWVDSSREKSVQTYIQLTDEPESVGE